MPTNQDCTLPPVTAKLFSSLDCIRIDGAKYARTDTSIDCDSAAFKRFQAFAGVLIAIYLCLPGMWAFLIYRKLNQLDRMTSDSRIFDEESGSLRFLLSDYRQGCEYTECIDM